MFGEGRKEHNMADISIKREATKLAEVCRCTWDFGLAFVHWIAMCWEDSLLLVKLKWLRGCLILYVIFCCLASRRMCFMLSLLPVVICKLPSLKNKINKTKKTPNCRFCWWCSKDSAKSFVRRLSTLAVAYQNQLLEAEDGLVSRSWCQQA